MPKPETETVIEIIESRQPKAEPRSALVAQPAGSSPRDLVALAVQRGADLATIEKLMDLQDRFDRNEARKAYTVAMTAFKAEPLEIFKRKTVAFLDVSYKHAELADVCDVIVPALARHGLAHRWDVRQDGDRIIVDCIITHALGHSEKVTLEGKADASGKKNAIQAVGSAVAYLERYSLLAATGMSTKSMPDDDGAGSGGLAADELTEEDEAARADLEIAAMQGEEALQQAFQGSSITDEGWRRCKASLIDAAKKADRDTKAKAGRKGGK